MRSILFVVILTATWADAAPAAQPTVVEAAAPAEAAVVTPASASAKDVPSASVVRIIVLGLLASNLPREHAELVSASLLSEVRKLADVSVMGMEELRAILSAEEQDAMKGCSQDQSCIANIAGALGADWLIMGDVGRFDSSSMLHLQLLDMRTGQVQEEVSRRMRGGEGEEFLEAIGPAVASLLPNRPLRAGASRGVSAQVVARWNPPPVPRRATIIAGSGAGAALIVAAGFYVRQRMATSDYNDLMDSSTERGALGRRAVELQDRANSSHTVALISGAIGLVTGVAAGVMAFFTDWQGEVTVQPTVAPQAGAGVTGVGLIYAGQY